jgi:Xaa-Pro dipeptidase
MKDEGIDNLLISDPSSIFYLTGHMYHTIERMCVLLLSVDVDPILYVHKMFPVRGLDEVGVRSHLWDDTDDYLTDLSHEFDLSKQLGVDKQLKSEYLLGLMNRGLKKMPIVGSYIIDDIRAVKSDEELRLMQVASDINDKVCTEIEDYIHNYDGDPNQLTERHCVEKLQQLYEQYTDEGFSFDPIIGFGVNATDAHHETDDTVLKEGDCIIIDIGCIKDGYASDMTRTCFYKKIPEFGQEIFDIVFEAQRRAEAAVKPGMKRSDIDAVARDYITEKGYGEEFNHRLGHFIGQECHEAGDISGSDHNIIKVGNCFSIEPGIYIRDKATGVRCENIGHVTEDGFVSFNKLPMDVRVL